MGQGVCNEVRGQSVMKVKGKSLSSMTPTLPIAYSALFLVSFLLLYCSQPIFCFASPSSHLKKVPYSYVALLVISSFHLFDARKPERIR